MSASGDIYSQGTFWLTAALVVITIGAFVVSVYLVRSQAPKRRLGYQLGPSLSMLASPYAQQLEIWAAVGDERRQRLQNPHVTTIIIGNTGRLDIATSMFDDGRPITVGFGARVSALGVLDESEPGKFPVSLINNELQFGPGLLRKGDRVSVTVLTDGEPELSIDAPLLDFALRVSEFASTEDNKPGPVIFTGTLPPVIFAAGISLLVGILISAGFFTLATLDNGTAPNQVRVPGLAGEQQSVAIQGLQSKDLKAGDLIKAESPEPAGKVLATIPAQGQIVNKNSKVSLIISSGP